MAAVRLDDFLGDRQTQTTPFGISLGIGNPVEPFKEVVQVIRCDAPAGIGDRDADIPVFSFGADGDASAAPVLFNRIADQV